jgi:hypothetical protein
VNLIKRFDEDVLCLAKHSLQNQLLKYRQTGFSTSRLSFIIAPMPTPFYHLSIADSLLASTDMPARLNAFLNEQRCAFYLGKTAPDVQTISGQSRPETHFYRVPLVEFTDPWDRMFKRYPHLGEPAQLSPAHAAFIAGYICHLQADVIWIKDLFVPYFLPRVTTGDRKYIGHIHNALRTYLDEQILPDLQHGAGTCLHSARPDRWLPFVEQNYLEKWRDFISEQLMPGAESQTVKVFAERLHMTTEEFLDLVRSEDRMEREVFSFVPRHVLVEYRDKLIATNTALLVSYLGGKAGL